MDFSTVNWLAVVASVVASMVIGGVWFGPKTFFPIWWKAIGKPEHQAPGAENAGGGAGMAMVWVLLVVASTVQIVAMALMVHALGSLTGGVTLISGALTGFLMWLGFVAPASLTNKLFADQLKAWVIEMGSHLITYVVIGAILGAWR